MIPNLILLTGSDDFRIAERKTFLKKKFEEKYPNGEIKIFEEDSEIKEIENAIATPNLFGGKRLLFTQNFWTPENFEKAEKINLFSVLKENEEIATLVAIETKLDKRLRWTKFFLENAKVENLEMLEEAELIEWIQKKCDESSKKITKENAIFLLSRCGTNLWNLSREIEKLCLATDREFIEKDLITDLTIPNPEAIIWDFVESISKKNAQKAIQTLQDLLSSGSTIHEILPMIAREIRIHALIKAGLKRNLSSGEIAKETGLHPFVVQKTIPFSKNFSDEEIETMYDDLFEIDKNIKTGGFYATSDDTKEIELAIERFILKLTEKK